MASTRRKFDPSLFKYQRGTGGTLANKKLRGAGKYTGERTTEGYIYEGKSPFAFKTPGGKRVTVEPGERLSSRQYQNLRYQALGWKSKSQFETVARESRTRQGRDRLTRTMGRGRIHQVGAFRAWGEIYADTHNVSLSNALAPDSDFSIAFARALADDFSDLSPDGPFAQLLIVTGLRDDDAQWNVGDTP